MPEMTDPKQMREATRSYLGKKEAYGPLLEKQEAKTVSGGTVAFWLVNVFSLLDGICRAGGAFYDLLRSCAEKAGGRALRFAIYSDEVIPGNVLAARTSRKSWCIYLSCIDFPAQVLAMEEAWLTIALLRSSFVASLEGSISQIFKIIFRSIFLHSKHDPAAGVWMQGPKGGFHLSFEPSMVIQDGAAHKFAWSVKGDSGSKYCLLCGNQRADNRNEEKIPKHAHAALHLVSDDDIWDSWSRLADLKGRCSAKDFGMWQQATGWTFNTESIFSEPLLRRVVKPATMFVHDWMHCCLSNGTLNDATWLLLSATKDHGFKDVFATLEKYVDLWTQPASFAHVKLKQVFENKRMKSCREAGKFKTTASEMLSLLPVLAFFVRTCILDKGFLPSECEAFLQMCLMVELLQAACHGHGCVIPSMLREAADKCMSSWFETGWGEHVTRKMHWLLHMGDHYEKHKRLPATFSMERKHRTITRYAASIQNTSTFERSLYEEVLAHELWHLEKLPEFPVALALENPRQKPPPKLRDLVLQSFPQVSKDEMKIATILRLPGGGLASKADVCLLQADKGRDPPWDCAEVFCHVSVQGTLWSVVSLWSLQEYNKDKHCAVWTEMEQPVIIESKDILTAAHGLMRSPTLPFAVKLAWFTGRVLPAAYSSLSTALVTSGRVWSIYQGFFDRCQRALVSSWQVSHHLTREALDILVQATTPAAAVVVARARLTVQIATSAPPAVLDLVEACCERDLPWTNLLRDSLTQVGRLSGLTEAQLQDSPMRVARAHCRLLRGACKRMGRYGSCLMAFQRVWRTRATHTSTGTIGTPQPVSCPECGWTGRSQQALAAHRHRKHGILARATALCDGTTCSWCLRDFHSSDRLKYHISTTPACRLSLEISVGPHHTYGSGSKRRGPQQHRFGALGVT
ncbi:unnamed protein product [Symbiodinium sp. CCMP2592]|nr:unnamed protein product [Symbiodinium sp. CCMP2592]